MCVWVCTCMCVRIDIKWMCTVFSLYVRVCYHVCWDVICVFQCIFIWALEYSCVLLCLLLKILHYNPDSCRIHEIYKEKYTVMTNTYTIFSFLFIFVTFFIVANILSKVITILCFVWRIYYHHNSVLYTNVFFSAQNKMGTQITQI